MSPATGQRRRAVFISDVHLGARHCHAAELADFLAGLHCDKLYLVGDIVDLWWLAQRRATWGHAHNRVVEALHALRRAGTELVYIPGNHDRPIRRFCGLRSEEHTSELQSLMRTSYAVFCLKKKNNKKSQQRN